MNATGGRLGLVGNSGRSPTPHLHASVLDPEGRTLPLPLSDVLVKLNPGPEDPWAFRVDEWPIRAGWFVEGHP